MQPLWLTPWIGTGLVHLIDIITMPVCNDSFLVGQLKSSDLQVRDQINSKSTHSIHFSFFSFRCSFLSFPPLSFILCVLTFPLVSLSQYNVLSPNINKQISPWLTHRSGSGLCVHYGSDKLCSSEILGSWLINPCYFAKKPRNCFFLLYCFVVFQLSSSFRLILSASFPLFSHFPLVRCRDMT